jgi:hypothetical protein
MKLLLSYEEIERIEGLGEAEGVDFEEFWMHEDALVRIAKAQLKKIFNLDAKTTVNVINKLRNRLDTLYKEMVECK